MLKSDLIHALAKRNPDCTPADISAVVNTILKSLTETLQNGHRIELRGFGSFKLTLLAARNSRNPKTGEKIVTPAKVRVHFRPGTEMRVRVQNQHFPRVVSDDYQFSR